MDEAQQLAELGPIEVTISALLAALGLGLLFRMGLLRRPKGGTLPPLRLQVWDVAGAFVAILLMAPALASIIASIVAKVLYPASTSSPQFFSWYPFLLVGSQAFALIAFLKISGKSFWLLWRGRPGPESTGALGETCRGIAVWLMAMPTIIFTSMCVSLLMLRLAGVEPLEQPVVQQLRQLTGDPQKFLPRALLIAVFIPALEEILFRGVIHSWLRQRFSARTTIFLSSMFFAAVHYAPSIGWSNVEVLVSLFVLALFLGKLYERTHALWAPAALHGSFNLGTVLVILATGA